MKCFLRRIFPQASLQTWLEKNEIVDLRETSDDEVQIQFWSLGASLLFLAELRNTEPNLQVNRHNNTQLTIRASRLSTTEREFDLQIPATTTATTSTSTSTTSTLSTSQRILPSGSSSIALAGAALGSTPLVGQNLLCRTIDNHSVYHSFLIRDIVDIPAKNHHRFVVHYVPYGCGKTCSLQFAREAIQAKYGGTAQYVNVNTFNVSFEMTLRSAQSSVSAKAFAFSTNLPDSILEIPVGKGVRSLGTSWGNAQAARRDGSRTVTLFDLNLRISLTNTDKTWVRSIATKMEASANTWILLTGDRNLYTDLVELNGNTKIRALQTPSLPVFDAETTTAIRASDVSVEVGQHPNCYPNVDQYLMSALAVTWGTEKKASNCALLLSVGDYYHFVVERGGPRAPATIGDHSIPYACGWWTTIPSRQCWDLVTGQMLEGDAWAGHAWRQEIFDAQARDYVSRR
eukprot:TRINITY_DN67733_c4_g2_i1.p1 TRINITY_DN67733_c4_g2~~TRINITY_DN67733_c4_g2_i1.p1  ORF type:complete len:458 (-),score=4.34 TRINITY_DN67733_c4_g2_i1:916-2289(-)